MKRNSISWVYSISLLLFLVILSIPDLNFIGTEVVLVVFCLWFFFLIRGYTNLLRNEQSFLFWIWFFFLIIVLYKLIGVSTAGLDIAATYLGWVVAYTLAIYTSHYFDEKRKKIFFVVILSITVLWALYVFIEGYDTVQMARQLELSASNDEESGILIEAASYSSLLMIFSGTCLVGFLNTHSDRLLKYIFFFSFFIAVAINFIILQRGTNVFLTLLMIFLILVNNGKMRKHSKLFAFFVSILFFTLYLTGVYSAVIDAIIPYIPSARIASRVESVNILLQTQDYIEAGTSAASRGELIVRSITTFMHDSVSFFFGIGDHRANNFLIGNHSEIIDCFARYGLLGGLLLFMVLKSQKKYIESFFRKGEENSKLKKQVNVIFLIYVLRNILGNAFTAGLGIQMFFFLPFSILILKTKNQKL